MDADLLKQAQAKGTDAEFRAFIQRQPSCLSGSFSEWLEDGSGRSVAAHVRNVSRGAGIAIKPPYSCIPLTFREHMKAHHHGDSALMPRDRWSALAEYYLLLWLNS